LPWLDPVPPHHHPLLHLAIAGAFINIGAPLAILWLATRRRVLSLRLLLALPATVAIPLAGTSALGSLLPNRSTASPWDAAGPLWLISLGGLPLLAYARAFGSGLMRGRWKRVARLMVLTALASLVIGGLWLKIESTRGTPSREHYTYDGWYHVAWWGAYALGVLVLLTPPARAAARLAWRALRYGLRRLARVTRRFACRLFPDGLTSVVRVKNLQEASCNPEA
jgi:hypothetical protein